MKKAEKNYMGIDQWGNDYHNLGPHPRKALAERIGVKHIAKMYVDTTSGQTKHIGYVVGRHWVRLYEIKPFEGK